MPTEIQSPEIEHDDTERDVTRGPITEASARAATALFGIGRLWAAHGLGVGRSALAASAQTLRATSELLGDLAEAFEEPRPEESHPSEPEPSA